MSPSFTHKSIKRFAQFRANEPRFFLTHVSHGHSPIRSLPRWPMYNEILSVASLKAAVAAARSTGARLRVVRCAWLTEACQNRCAQGMFLRTGRLTGGDGKCRTGKRWTKHQRQKKKWQDQAKSQRVSAGFRPTSVVFAAPLFLQSFYCSPAFSNTPHYRGLNRTEICKDV